MNPRAIQTAPCPACGDPAKPPPPSEPDRPWACSPCRAEWARAIRVTPFWPHHASDYFREGPCDREAVRASLGGWAQSLSRTVAGLLELVARTAEGGAGAVAHALMGGEPPWRLTLLPGSTDVSSGFTLTGLPPDVARHLAASCAMAEGPLLSSPELVRLREARRSHSGALADPPPPPSRPRGHSEPPPAGSLHF